MGGESGGPDAPGREPKHIVYTHTIRCSCGYLLAAGQFDAPASLDAPETCFHCGRERPRREMEFAPEGFRCLSAAECDAQP